MGAAVSARDTGRAMSSGRITQLPKRWAERHSPELSVVAVLLGFLAVAYLVLKLAPDWFGETGNLDAKGRADARQGVRTASLALLAGTVGVLGAVYTARTFSLNRAGQLTDRFSTAIEHLGHETLDVRLGGIYALERVTRDSLEDRPQVFEVLTAYVREHAPQASDGQPAGEGAPKPPHPATDIQAVLTVLGRRSLAHEQDAPLSLDLARTDLTGVDASKASLGRANLQMARLTHARFDGADLSEAWLGAADLAQASLSDVDLTRAQLDGANLDRALLSGATLYGASLARANLSQASLSGATINVATLFKARFDGADLFAANLSESYLVEASLTGAQLKNANLSAADLSGADLAGADLTDANLSGTVYDKQTTWPKGFDPEAAGAVRRDRGDENPEPDP